MRVIAYSILEQEKELLIKANSKVHDFTFISNPLTMDTMHFVEGKEVIVISERDVLDQQALVNLYHLGVRSVITRTTSTAHIDLSAAGILRMHVANTPFDDQTPYGIATQVVQNLTNWMVGGCAGKACQCRMDCAKKSTDAAREGGQPHGR